MWSCRLCRYETSIKLPISTLSFSLGQKGKLMRPTVGMKLEMLIFRKAGVVLVQCLVTLAASLQLFGPDNCLKLEVVPPGKCVNIQQTMENHQF